MVNPRFGSGASARGGGRGVSIDGTASVSCGVKCFNCQRPGHYPGDCKFENTVK